MKERAQFNHKHLWAMIVVLLIAGSLRWQGLSELESMLMFDEAYNGWDALQLMDSPRLTPFLFDNNGRESGWHYFLIPFLLGLGARPFALHFAASVAGVLTVALVYRLGTELVNKNVGVWSALALAVLYWHVHLGHLGLRAILWPFVGTMAFFSLLHAHRINTLKLWTWAGVWIGFLMYTYFSARLWILFAGLWLVWWWLKEPEKQKGSFITLLTASIIVLPQLLYTFYYPEQSLDRINDVAIYDWAGIWDNLIGWSGAWLKQGDINPELNYAGRAILDIPLAMLVLLGLFGFTWKSKQCFWKLWFLVGLASISILPSIFSDNAPHFLRSFGLVIPISIIIGEGARQVVDLLSRVRSFSYGIIILLLIFFTVGAKSYRDFSVWLSHPEAYRAMEMHINMAAKVIRQEAPEMTPVYFAPFSPFHPNIAFIKYGLSPRYVGGFSSTLCQVINDLPALYVSVPTYEPSFRDRLSQWAELEVWAEPGLFAGENLPYYMIYQSANNKLDEELSPIAGGPIFDNRLSIRYTQVEKVIRPGDELTIWLAFRAVHPIPKVISAFVHLYGYPLPTEGGHLWTQSDSQICEPYPSTIWQPEETILQEFRLKIPADIPAGQYEIHVGTYESPAGARLPLTGPITNLQNSYPIAKIEVTSP